MRWWLAHLHAQQEALRLHSMQWWLHLHEKSQTSHWQLSPQTPKHRACTATGRTRARVFLGPPGGTWQPEGGGGVRGAMAAPRPRGPRAVTLALSARPAGAPRAPPTSLPRVAFQRRGYLFSQARLTSLLVLTLLSWFATKGRFRF
jgi:hypothetical protein